MTIRPRRSVLYMPGSNARALEKAKELETDCVIFDLEDAVAPDQKERARDQVASAVAAGGYGRREVIIRVNASDTPWGDDDLAAAIAAGPDAILVPKVSRDHDLTIAADAITAAGAEIVLWAMMETPLAILNADRIALHAEHPTAPLGAFVMGTNDLAKETRARPDHGRQAMLSWLSYCVLAARACGIDVIDGVYNDFRNEEGFRDECAQGARLGMDGKTLIHPAQIAPCNEIFAPSDEDIAWARSIIAAFERPENQGRGAITIDGRMVELLHCETARRTVAIAEAMDEAGGAQS